jgi:hypothetical protein
MKCPRECGGELESFLMPTSVIFDHYRCDKCGWTFLKDDVVIANKLQRPDLAALAELQKRIEELTAKLDHAYECFEAEQTMRYAAEKRYDYALGLLREIEELAAINSIQVIAGQIEYGKSLGLNLAAAIAARIREFKPEVKNV